MAEKKTASKAKEETVDLKAEKLGEGGDFPETPSGQALKEVGADGDGEDYAAAKAKVRWGH